MGNLDQNTIVLVIVVALILLSARFIFPRQ
jgi:hypothetical protein